MKTFVYNIYDQIAEADYDDEIVAESEDEATKIMSKRYNENYFWKLVDVIEF